MILKMYLLFAFWFKECIYYLLSFRQTHIRGYSHMFFILSWNFKSLSMVIPSNFSDWLVLIWASLILTVNSLLVFNNTWHLSALAFISLFLKHWKIAQATSSKSLTMEEILSPVKYGVLLSAKLAISSFLIMK